MEIPEITDVDGYSSAYRRLRDALGVECATPAPGEVEFLRAVATRGRFEFGMLPPPDVFFAAAVTSILAPCLAIEVGTASGYSAAIIAKMIALRRSQTTRSPSGPLVHTIDHKATYMLDRTKPCGFAISLVTPELRDRIVVHAPQDSSQCREIVGNGELTFAFIDGNHRHPWPLVDFLRLHSLIKSGWVLLHDVDLPDLIARTIAAGHKVDHVPVFGAKHVYDLWPHEKVRAGNIAVLKVASSTDSLGDFVSQMRTLPSEVSAGSWIKRWREIDSLMGTRAL